MCCWFSLIPLIELMRWYNSGVCVCNALNGVDSYRYHCSIKSKMMLLFFVFRCVTLSEEKIVKSRLCKIVLLLLHMARKMLVNALTIFFSNRRKCWAPNLFTFFLKLLIWWNENHVCVYVYTHLRFNLGSSNFKIMANAAATEILN